MTARIDSPLVATSTPAQGRRGLRGTAAARDGLTSLAVAVVIPAYNVAREIAGVLNSLPSFVRHVIVVDDGSRDDTAQTVERIAERQPRIVLLRHPENRGVGGAMVTGFEHALTLGAQIVAKIDGDGQMSSDDLPALLAPLIRGDADYAKGNRFGDFQTLVKMPYLRRAGNMALSFLAKAATGYWNCFDPTNGFIAIRGEVLAQLRLNKIDRGYFFEHSMLSELYLIRAVVRDIFMPARYADETSHLSISRVLGRFPRLLLRSLLRRLVLKNFIYDFSMESIYLLAGLPMLITGVLYGGYHWYMSTTTGIPARTGTVVIPAMLIVVAFQMLLAAIELDLRAVPLRPICRSPLLDAESVDNNFAR